MNLKKLTCIVLLTLSPCLSQAIEPSNKESDYTKLEISSQYWRALLVAMQHLKNRDDYSIEQRRLENYKVWVESTSTEIQISFLAVRRHGDEQTKGGNFEYARSTTYILSPKSFEITKIYGSK